MIESAVVAAATGISANERSHWRGCLNFAEHSAHSRNIISRTLAREDAGCRLEWSFGKSDIEGKAAMGSGE